MTINEIYAESIKNTGDINYHYCFQLLIQELEKEAQEYKISLKDVLILGENEIYSVKDGYKVFYCDVECSYFEHVNEIWYTYDIMEFPILNEELQSHVNIEQIKIYKLI